MSFVKQASVMPLAVADFVGGRFQKVAHREGRGASSASPSYFLDGARSLSVGDLLEAHAARYEISPDPSNYIFEAMRACTAQVPNENFDAFTRGELLRYDLALRMPVYATFTGKPHHTNHDAADPTRALGMVFDAHYNDRSPALAECPQCHSKVARRENRDESGIHCKRCGATVKDEFVEILVGVDTKKDPWFANGVRTGQLTAGSMGCTCESTTCVVCNHQAFNKHQFCPHIRRGKGALWKRGRDGDWVKTSALEIERELDRVGWTFRPQDFRTVRVEDGTGALKFEARRGSEDCVGVIYDEYSRVYRPADPKALRTEMIRAASKNAPEHHAEHHAERRAARQFFLVQDPALPGDPMVLNTLEDVADFVTTKPGAKYQPVEAPDPETAKNMFQPGDLQEFQQQADVLVTPPPGEEVVVQQPADNPANITEVTVPEPGGPEAPLSPDDLNEELMGPGAPQPADDALTPGEMGIMPPGAEKDGESEDEEKVPMNTYAKWKVLVGRDGAVMLKTAEGEEVARLKAPDAKTAQEAGKRVASALQQKGLVATLSEFGGRLAPKVAQVLEHHTDTFDPGVDAPPSAVTDDAQDNVAGASQDNDPQGPHANSTMDNVEYNNAEPPGTPPANALDGETPTPATSEDGAAMDPKHESHNPGQDTALSEKLASMVRVGARIARSSEPEREFEVVDVRLGKGAQPSLSVVARHDERDVKVPTSELSEFWTLKAAPDEAARRRASKQETSSLSEAQQKFIAKRIEVGVKKKLAEAQEQGAGALDKFVRAMYVVAARQDVELTPSLLKKALVDMLATEHAVGRNPDGSPLQYHAMPRDLAEHLVTAALQTAHGQHVEDLAKRAHELANKSDDFLVDAEKDVREYEPRLPKVSAQSVHPLMGHDEFAVNAAHMRQQAVAHNAMPVMPQHENAMQPLEAQRASLRQTVAGTRLGHRTANLHQG